MKSVVYGMLVFMRRDTHTHTPILYLQKETSERTIQNLVKILAYREGRAQLGAGVDLLFYVTLTSLSMVHLQNVNLKKQSLNVESQAETNESCVNVMPQMQGENNYRFCGPSTGRAVIRKTRKC